MQPMLKCHVCRADTDANLCKVCTKGLEQAIAELPADLSDLQAVAARQAMGPLGLGLQRPGVQWDGPFEEGSLGDAPWEFAPGAADQVWALENTVTTWARHLIETRDADPPKRRAAKPLPGATRRIITGFTRNRPVWGEEIVTWIEQSWPVTLVDVCRWLLDNVQSFRYDEAAEQAYEEFMGLHDDNERWIFGRRGTEVFAGRCDATDVTFVLNDAGTLVPEAATCGTALYGNDSEPDLYCPTCGMKYRLAERVEARDKQIEDQLARPHQIATALTEDDWPLSADLLRKWIQRDAMAEESPEGPACEKCSHKACRLIRRALILQRGTDKDGKALYRFGDVRARLALVQTQRGIRLSA